MSFAPNLRDLRYALRVYRRTPVFSTIASIVLAVAIAVATAVFNLYTHLALTPVPGVQGGDRLASIGLARDANEWIPFSNTQYQLLAETLTVSDATVATSVATRLVDVEGLVSEAVVAGVSPGFLRELGVRIVLGSNLDGASGEPEAPIAVVSERFWRERLGARQAIIGETILVEDEPFTVVGVAGGGFTGLRRGAPEEDVWMPIGAALGLIAPAVALGGPRAAGLEAQARQFVQTMPLLSVTARLPAGADIARLQQELDLVWPRIRDASRSPLTNELMRLEAVPGTAADPRRYAVLVRQSQLLVGGAVLVLLVASLNLASFMLSRGPGRLAELRTRLAIGASGGAIVRQLFMEAALLIMVATGMGAVLHYWLRSMLLRLPPFVDAPSTWTELQTDWRVGVFIVAVAFVVTLIAGLLPAVGIASKPRLSLAAQTAMQHRSGRLQPLLVLQVAVATLVVLAGTLFLGEVWRLERAPAGFDPDGVMAGQLLVPSQAGGGVVRRQASQEQMEQFADDLAARASAVTGVEGVALASAVPFHTPATNSGVVELAGVAEQPADDRRRVYHNLTTPDFFRVLRARFVAGRPFDPADPFEVVVSRSLARQLWGRDDVTGERLTLADADLSVSGQRLVVVTLRGRPGDDATAPEVYTVVGVADDMRYAGMEDEYPPMLYRQWAGSLLGQRYIARGPVSVSDLHAIVDEFVKERFPLMQAERPAALTESMLAGLRDERARGRLALGAAMIALLLTVLGLYASMQHTVEARRGELALRKAVGATDARLVAMILRRASVIAVLGCAGALLGAILLAEPARALLLGLDALSASSWAVTVGVVVLTCIAAAWWPAVRAGRVDPVVALRYD